MDRGRRRLSTAGRLAIAAAMIAMWSVGTSMAQPGSDEEGIGDGCLSGQEFPVAFGETLFVGCAVFGGANWCRQQDGSFVLCPDLPILEQVSAPLVPSDDPDTSRTPVQPDRSDNSDFSVKSDGSGDSAHQPHDVSPGTRIIITELMAINDGFLPDDEGQFPDWIEIHNIEEDDISLKGWSITDDPDEPRKWMLPDLSFIGGGYYVVFASGKDRIDNPQALHTNFRLKADGEYVALVRPDGTIASAIANDYPRQYPNGSYGIPDVTGLRNTRRLENKFTFLEFPTPNAPNSGPKQNYGPYIASVQGNFDDEMPPAGSDILIGSIVTDYLHPVAEVSLIYRTNYGRGVTVAMIPEKGQGNSVFTAAIPATAFKAGDMVRWFVMATDIEGNISREPSFASKEYPQYYGTVIANPKIQSALPVLHWFTNDAEASTSVDGLRGSSVYYDGEFYDNVYTRRRGVTALTWPKPKIKFDFKGKAFKLDKKSKVEEFNLQSFWEEPGEDSYLREPIAFKVMNEAGLPASESFHVRVHQNGEYFGLFAFVEQVDDSFLEKHGRSLAGPLFKSLGELSNFRWDLKLEDLPWRYRKGNRQEVLQDWEKLLAFIKSLGGGGNLPRSKFIFDMIDLPQVINYMALNNLLLNQDRCSKNFYSYMDPITNRWSIFPWDTESTFGISSGLGGAPAPDYCVLVCEQWNSPLYCDSDHPQELDLPFGFAAANGRRLKQLTRARLRPKTFQLPSAIEYDEDKTTTFSPVGAAGSYNHLDDAILDWPVTREMYFRRLRTLMDQFLNGRLEKLITEMYNLIREEAIMDNNVWGVTTDPTAVDRGYRQLMDEQLPTRRSQLYEVYGPNGTVPLIPDEQPAAPDMQIVRVDLTSVNQEEQYIEIFNPNRFAVDVSGWKLTGSTDFLFPPGAVVVARGNVFLSPDIFAFHNRAEEPTGGQGNFVLGTYSPLDPETQISLVLLNDQGTTITSV